ncbi:non-hydrolyzing UDP-N-acetylglucosamine 2-epimerase [Methylomarinum vadi]|uniref:non-hydrolyzing UDP-N-acetylglucosamine 2-epimerase n=1 Tax=Methylomarinum vadi TaxID=438855 RepID=UPI0004DF9601|nr:UDP-N-acetylglucosamine 2-epimerase (non-hydrolyzing) [Methylomarinum vadi]
MKICTVIGARPQFIKAAVVSRAFREHATPVQEVIVHTGQHFDANMSQVFFEELGIPHPNYNLGIGGGTHGQNTGRMIEGIEQVLLQEKPDWLLVYGDTDSTLAGALAAVKLHISVAHVEAGLRSFNRKMPEEINRILTDHAADRLFTPTKTAVNNLSNEGISVSKVQNIGDVMYDAALYYGRMAEQCSQILAMLDLTKKKYVLATLHRQENVDDPERLDNIMQGLAASHLPIVMPLHPRTRNRLQEFAITVPASVKILDPVGYLDMVMLEKNAVLIATDSGGVQKEAYFHKTPCITLRDETEWLELVEIGWNTLVGADVQRIQKAINFDNAIGNQPDWVENVYGDGKAGEKITSSLIEEGKQAI